MSATPDQSADDLTQGALAYYHAGDFERCRQFADLALSADPNRVRCLVLKGMALNELDRPEEAIEVLRQATGAAPDEADAWRHLGIAQTIVGEMEEAAASFQTVLRVHPENLPALIDLGNVLFMIGRPDEAVEALEHARRLNPGDLPILRNLAAVYTATARIEPALLVIEEILGRYPGDILAHCDAAWLNFAPGRLDEAARAFRALLRLDPEHELFVIHGLALIEIRRQNWREALDLAIDATWLDRYEMTTDLLAFIGGKLFGNPRCGVSEEELNQRFEAEHREHRRLHAEVPD